MIAGEPDAQHYCSEIVGAEATERLEQFVGLLRLENAHQNLVAGASLSEIWRRHIADSVQLLKHVPRGTGEWLDLGSGAGLPGLVIAIAQPDRRVTLVESRRLRADWLQRATEQLALPNVRVEASRLEALHTRPAAIISARAFAPLSKLLRLSARFSTPETTWVLPKGRSAGQELQHQPRAVRRMFHVEPSLTDSDAGILIGRGVPELR